MIDELNTIITDGFILRKGFIIRDGFVFTISGKPGVFDTLVIRCPNNSVGPSSRLGFSEKSLEEHIGLVNRYQLTKAKIICKDLSFILECPSLSHISVYPDHEVGDGFDYSPLYQMPHLKQVCCLTKYGFRDEYKCTIDYSKISGVIDIAVAGQGHKGYEMVSSLETLWISNCRKHRDFQAISCSTNLKNVTLLQCGIQTLDGIEKHNALKSLALYHNRSLHDISALSGLGDSLRLLAIESCPKITDFTALSNLVNLEHLQLYGSNSLPSLSFLHNMTKLKTLTFTMNVEDGDLTHCKNVPYASCKNRKHFNLKDAQLPKQISG